MPNWTTDEGKSLFGTRDCKRCLQDFKTDGTGRIPSHMCLGLFYNTETNTWETG